MSDTKEKSQIEKFREKARELEADESEEVFEAVVRKIAKTRSKKGEG
ncbi:hypothetical protein PUV54_10320 [Hyphococcus flavus]|uniref:Uncharacterized protein n=1 Tax=Hyphococcus flavus TaxID=1866326 RepID=A0AAE9ZA36_9PROT|nr:hypothetical protein [Hyphococcus flavus]WDI30353.1 hypothetical protein PUV54_10320 [Hyphococcus flavus]